MEFYNKYTKECQKRNWCKQNEKYNNKTNICEAICNINERYNNLNGKCEKF